MSDAIKAAQEAIDRSAKIVEEMVAMIDRAPSVPDTKLLSYLQQENEVLIQRVRLLEIALAAEREACAKVAEDLASNTPQLLLHAGEMEPQELLTSKAVLKLVASLIRGRGEK